MEARLFWAALAAVRLNRPDIFGEGDDQLPLGEPGDALIPQIGYIGQDYRPGGTVLLGINPGGGGDAYRRTAEDEQLLPLISALREGHPSPDVLQGMFEQVASNMRRWNLWRILAPVLNACGGTQGDIAYLNWCPFRTRQNKKPRSIAMRRCHDVYMQPLIAELAPARIIGLGKKVGDPLQKTRFGNAECFVVPGTLGDTYLSQEALAALEELRRIS